jgi:hypothetical protein
MHTLKRCSFRLLDIFLNKQRLTACGADIGHFRQTLGVACHWQLLTLELLLPRERRCSVQSAQRSSHLLLYGLVTIMSSSGGLVGCCSSTTCCSLTECQLQVNMMTRSCRKAPCPVTAWQYHNCCKSLPQIPLTYAREYKHSICTAHKQKRQPNVQGNEHCGGCTTTHRENATTACHASRCYAQQQHSHSTWWLPNNREAIIVIVSASVRRGADAERYGLQEDYYYYYGGFPDICMNDAAAGLKLAAVMS